MFLDSGVVARRLFLFFLQAEDGIRDLVRSRGLGDVYKRQGSRRRAEPVALRSRLHRRAPLPNARERLVVRAREIRARGITRLAALAGTCLLYTSDAADERSSVDLGGRRIIQKKKQ